MANGLTNPDTLGIDPTDPTGFNLLFPQVPNLSGPFGIAPLPGLGVATSPPGGAVSPPSIPPTGPQAPPPTTPSVGAPSWLYDRILNSESSGDPTRMNVGAAGERGPMQITLGTARQYGADWDRLGKDPAYGMQVGRQIVDDLWRKSGGNWQATMVGYNAGEGNMARYLKGQPVHLAPLYNQAVYGSASTPTDTAYGSSIGPIWPSSAGGAGGPAATAPAATTPEIAPAAGPPPAPAQGMAGQMARNMQLAMLGQMIGGTRFIPVGYDPFKQTERIGQIGARMQLPTGPVPEGPMTVRPAEPGYAGRYSWPGWHFQVPAVPAAQPQAWLQLVREATQGR